MPRITGPTIEAHVAQQEAAVVRAATRLFAERGFAATTMADIAAEVGLARTSLYRYFPDKDHILLAWLRREIGQLTERSAAIAAAGEPGAVRLRRWLRLQVDYVADPDHELFTRIAATMGTLSPEVLAAVGEQHRLLYGTVEPIVADALAEAGHPRRDPALVARLVIGLLAAATQEVSRGANRSAVQAELQRAATAVVSA